MTAQPLLPAEATLLVKPARSSATHCIQAALLTLMGQGHLTIEEEGRFIKRRFLNLRHVDGDPLPPHLAIVKNCFDVRDNGGRVRSDQAVRSLQKAFGSGYRTYVHDVLAPPLIARGLLRREERKFLGLIRYLHYESTMAGEAKVATLRKLLDEAGGIKKLISTDPDRAIRIARAAGVLLILSPEAKAQLPRLKVLMHDRGSGDGGGVYPCDDSNDSDWNTGIDLSTFDFATEFSMLDSIGSVGDFTGDDGGGDSGGDGGGD